MKNNRIDKIFDFLASNNINTKHIMERFLNDKELYKVCLDAFLLDPNFVLLKSNVETENYKQVSDCVHTLYGVALNLGLEYHFKILLDIQDSINLQQYNLTKKYCIEIEKQLADFKNQIS